MEGQSQSTNNNGGEGGGRDAEGLRDSKTETTEPMAPFRKIP